MEDAKGQLIAHIARQGITDVRVLNALKKVPRELFVPKDLRELAYEDRPLPIGWDQTISQPYTVAFMAQLLDITPGSSILEIGCGSGYNAAILQELTGEQGLVCSVERIPELASYAQSRLKLSGYDRIQIILSDGKKGCPAYAPFDRIMVTAQGPEIPPALIDQLCPGGTLVMPVDNMYAADMVRMVKHLENDPEITYHGAFSFVPLR